jgi:hypothetical protein
MRAMMLGLLLAAASTLCSCASRADLAVKRIDSAVHAYGEAHPRKMYPSTLKELTAFAAATGKPLDLTPFSKITFERSSHTSMSITYETPKPSWSYGALVYSAAKDFPPVRSNQTMQRTPTRRSPHISHD